VHVVGPLTAKAPEPLPADLEAFMQSAGQFGVVYASLGYTAIPGRVGCVDNLAIQQIVPESFVCMPFAWWRAAPYCSKADAVSCHCNHAFYDAFCVEMHFVLLITRALVHQQCLVESSNANCHL